MQITEQNIIDAIADARRGELNGHTYNQSQWCGTRCCVLGFARIRAGMPELNKGPQPGEIEDTPRARMLAALMNTPSPSVLDAMELVQPDGSIEYSGNLYLNSLTSVPEGVTLKAGGIIYLNSLTSVPEGYELPSNAYAPKLRRNA